MSVGIIDYGAGNIRSLRFSLERIGVDAFASSDPSLLGRADRIIFPGVGAAGHAMQHLRASGLDAFISGYHRPLLGICLGMQLLCRHSEEDEVACLDVFPVDVRRFDAALKVPHTGWNAVWTHGDGLFAGLRDDESMYFVHSYAAATCSYTIGEARYPGPFSAALRRDNFYGVQFHPEKSGIAGEQLLRNFMLL